MLLMVLIVVICFTHVGAIRLYMVVADSVVVSSCCDCFCFIDSDGCYGV